MTLVTRLLPPRDIQPRAANHSNYEVFFDKSPCSSAFFINFSNEIYILLKKKLRFAKLDHNNKKKKDRKSIHLSPHPHPHPHPLVYTHLYTQNSPAQSYNSRPSYVRSG